IGASASIGASARIGASASIGDYASIGDSARIGDYASIGASARIARKVALAISPLQIQGPKFLVYPFDGDRIGVGCEIHTLAKWEEIASDLAEENELSEEDAAAYGVYIRMVHAWAQANIEPVAEEAKV